MSGLRPNPLYVRGWRREGCRPGQDASFPPVSAPQGSREAGCFLGSLAGRSALLGMEPWLLRQRKLCPLTSDPLFEPSSSEKCGPSPEAGRRGQWTGCPALHTPETGSPGAPGHRSRGGCRPQAQAGAHEGRATAGVWIRAGPPWAGRAGESGSLVPQQEQAGSPEHCRSHPAPSASSLQNMRD